MNRDQRISNRRARARVQWEADQAWRATRARWRVERNAAWCASKGYVYGFAPREYRDQERRAITELYREARRAATLRWIHDRGDR